MNRPAYYFHERQIRFLNLFKAILHLGLPALLAFSAALAQAAPFAYITNQGSNTVSVIDTASNTVTATVPVGSVPFGVAVTPDGAFVYVANANSNTVSVIATASNTVTATVPVGVAPFGVAVTPDGALVYVANQQSNTVSVIATASNTVTATVPVGINPVGVAVTPDGAFVYVSNANSNTVSVIAVAGSTVTATLPVERSPVGVAVTPDGAFVYVANQGTNTVSVIATASNTVTAMVGVGGFPGAFGKFIVGPAPVRRFCSTLGDNRPPSRLDVDVFRFTGAKGDNVMLTLSESPGPQNRGKRAALVLLADIPGVFFARFDVSDLPNQISAKLPAAGKYLVTVAQEPKAVRGSFTGNYCVTLQSSMGASNSFKATETVESIMP